MKNFVFNHKLLGKLRRDYGWSYLKLARYFDAELKKVGVELEPPCSPQRVCTWEQGRFEPNGAALIILARVFGIEASEFFTVKKG